MTKYTPTTKTADKYRQMLRTKGWKPTTIAIFGVSEEAWTSPHTGRALPFKAAIMSQKRQAPKSRK